MIKKYVKTMKKKYWFLFLNQKGRTRTTPSPLLNSVTRLGAQLKVVND